MMVAQFYTLVSLLREVLMLGTMFADHVFL